MNHGPEIDPTEVDGRRRSPEELLVLAVLMQGVQDAVSVSSSKNRSAVTPSDSYKARAIRWINSTDQRRLGFEWCCSIAGIDSQVVRERIAAKPLQVWRSLHPGARVRPEEKSSV